MAAHSYNKIRNTSLTINRSGDLWVIGANGSLKVSAGVAIYERDDVQGSDVRIAGKVSSKGSDEFAVFAGGRNGTWVVTETGVVRAASGFYIEGAKTDLNNKGLIEASKGYGAWFAQGDHSIINSGKISVARGVGLAMRDGSYTLVNDGLIDAPKGLSLSHADLHLSNGMNGEINGRQVAIQLSGGENSTIVNGGSITGRWAIFAGGGDDGVTNLGSMKGFVELKGGRDIFTQAAGSFSGYIYLGAGNDRFVYNGGDMTAPDGMKSQVYGGSGNDVFVTGELIIHVIERANGGIDRQEASQTTILQANIENLLLLGNEPLSGRGNSLNNRITGNSGDNFLFGYDGNDRLDGRAGNDQLFGGNGADIFVFATGSGNDMIVDMVSGVDRIDLHDLAGIKDFAGLVAHMAEVGSNVVITMGGGTLTLTSTTLASLEAADFIF